MRRALALAALLASLAPAAAPAQQVSERRVRAAIEDATRGLGQAVAGGSPLAGPSVATGGLAGLEAGASVAGTFLEVDDPTRETGTVDFALPTATLNGAVGILRNLDIVGRLGAVVSRGEVEGNAPVLALGARLGLLEDSALLPSVTATVTRSHAEDLGWNDPDGDDVSFAGDVVAWSARLDVAKAFLLVTPYAGVGVDRTTVDAGYRIPASRATGGEEIAGRIDASSTAAKAYAGARLSLALLALAVEIGAYDGGSFAAIGLSLLR